MKTNRIHTTAKGTELPLLNLKGKDYLEVKYRLVWFREEHPDWSIETQFLSIDERSACARAVVKDEAGRIIATSHKAETASNFPDFMEKAETGAIGRALALIGFGTQFCADELDEGDRIVDAPVAAKASYGVGTRVPGVKSAVSSAMPPATPQKPFNVGEFQINFGKKYLGKRVKDIPRKDLESYLDWLEMKAAEKQKTPGFEVQMLKEAVDRFHHPEKYMKKANEVEGRPKEEPSRVEASNEVSVAS